MLRLRIRERVRELDVSIEWLAAEIGLSHSYVSRMVRRERPLPLDYLEAMARALRTSVTSLIEEDGVRHTVPLDGYVGAGQAVYPAEEAGGPAEIDVPGALPPGTRALKVVGESWFPVYREGDVLLFRRELPPGEVLNRRAVVRLGDGRRLVKEVRRGTAPGLFRLTSFNAPEIEDVEIVRAAPIAWVRPDW